MLEAVNSPSTQNCQKVSINPISRPPLVPSCAILIQFRVFVHKNKSSSSSRMIQFSRLRRQVTRKIYQENNNGLNDDDDETSKSINNIEFPSINTQQLMDFRVFFSPK